MPRRYRKPSQTLLQLKQIENFWAIRSRAASEVEGLQAALVRDCRLAKDEKIRKQRAEREKLEKDRRRLRTALDGKVG
jgi:hypothetical protein